MMVIKLVVGGLTFNIIGAYAPEMDLNNKVKKHFGRIWMR